MKNFQGQNLVGYDFRGQYLRSANFAGANLSGADFTRAVLVAANFAGATCAQATFLWTNLKEATFIGANCEQADFSGANCMGTNFTHANLIEANLARVRCERATLTEANFDGAHLNRVNLERATWKGAIGLASWDAGSALLEQIRDIVVVKRTGALNMQYWDTCIAGWAMHLTGTQGFGGTVGVRLMPQAAHMFYASTDEVLNWLEQRGWYDEKRDNA